MCDWKHRKARTQLDKRILNALNDRFVNELHPLIEECKIQLEDYFNGKLTVFSLPYTLIGTEFQKKIWQKLLDIPYGRSMSYLELSQAIHQPEAIRAVATANGANALSIIVPCHRVIGSDGKLTGYAGGLPTKKRLLEIEGINFQPQQTRMFDNSPF